MIDSVKVDEFGAPPGSNRFVPRSLKSKPNPKGINMKAQSWHTFLLYFKTNNSLIGKSFQPTFVSN